MKAKLIQVQPETEDITSFIFEPERPVIRQAGQFLRYVLPHTAMDERSNDRYFTIASPPYKKYLQITTRFAEEPSSFKRALKRLPLGSGILIDEQPEGEFVVKDPSLNYIFVAGGIGITPFYAILAEAAHSGQTLSAHVLYGNNDKQILFKDELDSFVSKNSRLTIDYVTDSGGITKEQLKQAIDAIDNPYVYLSGPEPMVEALSVTVKKLEVGITHIQTDFFTGYDNS